MKQKALLEPTPLKAFRDKYLAALMMVAALLITSVVSAQTDSLKYSQINGYGFKYKRHVQDSVSIIPLSTSPHTPYRAGGIRYHPTDSTLQLWTGSQWLSIVTGVGNGIDTAYMMNDTILTIETPDEDFFLQVGKRHVDSIYRKNGQDSIFYKIAGIERAIKDSSVTSRFGLEDDTASSNRFFDLVGNSLLIDSFSFYRVTSKAKTSGADKGLYNRIDLDRENMYFMVSPSSGPSPRSYGFSAHPILTQMFARGHVSGHDGYVQADTTQVLLESDPNRLEVRHDSVTLSNINNGLLDFRVRGLPLTIDTSYKAFVSGPNGQVFLRPGDAGSGGGGGTPAGADREIQINNGGAFGVKTGTLITTDGTIVSDSVRHFKQHISGDSTFSDKIVFYPAKTKPGSSPALIGFSEDNNEYDADTTVNNTFQFKIGPLNGAAGSYIRLGLEKRWMPFPGAGYYWMEAHLPEVRLVNGEVYRPASWTGKETGEDGTWTHRANLHSFYDWNGGKSLGGFSRGAGELITYHNFSGNGVTEMSIRDTGTAVRAAGIRINGQIGGGNRTNTTDIYGQTIDWAWETAPIFTATAPGANSSNFNYTFKIPSSNTGHMLIIGKGSSVFDNVFFWMHNDGRVVAGDAGNFFSSYKFQAKSGTNSFVSGDFDASNNSVMYSGAWAHRLTSGAGASGMGAGFRFEADNSSNTQTIIADIAGVWSGTPTAGAENGDVIFRTRRAGTLTESLRSKANGDVIIDSSIYAKADSVTTATGGYIFRDATTGKWKMTAAPGASVLKGTANWTPGVVAAGSSATTTTTVTGAALGDPVTISKASGAYSNGEVYDAFVSATNTVTIRVHNVSTGSANYSSAADYNVIVIKY